MHGKILGVLCWTPFIWITWYISGLDPQIPLFDQWTLAEFYHAVLVGEAQWADFLAPHNNIHPIVFPRILLTSVALATSLDFKTEIWLSLLLVMATVYFIAKMMDRAGAGNESAVLLARFLCAALLCSPVIYWPWVWSVGFFHFLINLAVVGAAAFLVRGEQGEARARNVLAAMAFCMVASTTRAEGLATWLVFAPLLFSYTRALPHRRKWHLAWFSGALLAGLFFTYSVAAIGPGQPMTATKLGSLAGSLWLSAANILGLIGRPLGAGLQPWVPASWPDPAAFMPVGALMTTAFLGLSWLQLRAPDSPRRDVGLALACVGAFGLVFAGATAFAREGLGAFAPFRPMMYSVTSILVFVAVVNLGALYWGARPGERNSSGRPMLAGGAIVTVMLLLAGYFGAAGEALRKRRETLGSGDCWAVVSHLAERNTCFLGIPEPEVLEMFEQLGFSCSSTKE